MHNVGKIDRIIRILIAAIIFVLNHFEVIKGDWASGLLFFAFVMLMTGVKRCSPIYSLLGFGTCGIEKDDAIEPIIKTKKLKI